MSVDDNTRFHAFIASMCKRSARCLWSVPGPKMGAKGHRSRLEAWVIAGKPGILIVHAYPDDHGFDLFVNDGAAPPDSLAELEVWLGPTEAEQRANAGNLNPHGHKIKEGNGNYLCTVCRRTGTLAWLTEQTCEPQTIGPRFCSECGSVNAPHRPGCQAAAPEVSP